MPIDKKAALKEILTCGKDPIYFLKTYAKISHPLKGIIPFNTYKFQDKLLKDFNDHRFNVINKGRQLGISTITAGYIAWMMIFHRDKAILVMATKLATAVNLLKKVKSIIKNLPSWLVIADISIDNKQSFELTNGSTIKASSTAGDAGRSEALSLLVLDEAAHIEGLEELWTGVYPTLSTGGRCIVISTPNGVGNWFHKTCVGASTGENNFKLTTLMWWEHPDHDQAWFDNETKNMSKRQIAQELECNFNASGETVIDSENLDDLLKKVREPKHKTAFDRNFWIWKEVDPKSNYMLVSDVARGDGEDFSAFHIFEIETMEQVGEYKGKPTPDLYSNMLNQVGKEFNNALIIVENNSIGYNVLDKLIEYGYPNIYYSVKGTHEFVDQYEADYHKSVPGFTNSNKTRPLIIAKMEEFVRNGMASLNSIRLVDEFRTFVWTNGKPQSMKGYNDDLVMSFAIACWVRDTAIINSQKELNYQKAFLNSIIVSNTKFNTTIRGQTGYKDSNLRDSISEAYNIYNQYKWIIK